MSSRRYNRVAVIGAGVSGIVTAAHLKREGVDVTVFERGKSAGGVWFVHDSPQPRLVLTRNRVYDERKPLEPSFPSVTPSNSDARYLDERSASNTNSSDEVERLLHAPPGPCYVGLKNNVSTPLLKLTLNSFPPETPDYVTHDVLRDYLQETAAKTGVQELIRFNTEVKNLKKDGSNWQVEAVTLSHEDSGAVTRNRTVEKFDSVVVASGHYHAARVPDIPGVASWKRQWPDRVTHSKAYRSPDAYKGKNFLLIGSSASALDIARELSPQATNIYQSHRNGAYDVSSTLFVDNAIRVDEVVSFEEPTGEQLKGLPEGKPIPATITLKSGRKLCEIDHVIFCTGYHVTLPFLPQLHADDVKPEDANDTLLVTDGYQIHNLHKDIFYIKDPSLVFVGVPYFTATFTLFEFQAIVVAKVLGGQAALPSEEEMRAEYEAKVQEKGYGKVFHSLRGREVDYVNDLLSWVNRDLKILGKEDIHGHTDTWHSAMAEQQVRMKLFFTKDIPEKDVAVACF